MDITRSYIQPSHSAQDLWATEVLLGRIDVQPFLNERIRGLAARTGRPIDELDMRQYLDETSPLEALWTDMFTHLHRASGGTADVSRVELKLEVWRRGYEDPVLTTKRDYMGWLFLHGTVARHSDSGTVAILDPRTASSMSAVPGLPWGRSLVLRPLSGSLGIVPGWLTASVLPLEADQTAIVLRAFADVNDVND